MPCRTIVLLLVGSVVPAIAQQTCDHLTMLALPGIVISQASPVPAGDSSQLSSGNTAPAKDLPAFCRVQGVIRPEVRFELWLPERWNRKLLMVGNGGLAGTINRNAMLEPLRLGYATTSTDTGHVADTDGHWAAEHMERVIDFAHRSVHVTTQAAKAIVGAFYGAAPEHAYFQGCSQGGQEALTEAQRYPADYDGIIAGDPANYWTHLYMGAHLWITQATQADVASYIPASKTQLIGDAVNQACDALDGIQDGILNDPRRCHFDPSTLLCKNGDAPNCLTAPQLEAVKKIYQGARTAEGDQIFPGLMPGSEAGPTGWADYVTGQEFGRARHSILGLPFLRYVAFEDPNWDFRTFRFNRTDGLDSDVDFIDGKLGPIFNNINPDLAPFQAHGGKLIQYHGWSDPDISPLNSINYYQSVVGFVDRGTGHGLSETTSFYRLFMVPGMNHCAGGSGPNTFNALAALEQWVEHGAPPERIVASHRTNGQVDMTRPLCPYPKEAVYNGSGSTNDAASFTCQAR